jgi:hypothetical protein
VFAVFAVSQCSLAHILNDWGDRIVDRRQFKPNAFNGMSRMESLLALTLVVIVAFVTGTPLVWKTGFLSLWAVWAALSASFSLEPFRLKTKGVIGLFVSVVAQRFLPVLLLFSAFEVAGNADMWILAIAFSLRGIALDIGHQRSRRTRSKYARANTLAAGLSDKSIDQIYEITLLLDRVAVGTITVLIISKILLPGVGLMAYLALLVGVIFAGLFLGTLRRAIDSIRKGEVFDPYSLDPPFPLRVLHQYILDFFLPILLGISVSLRDPYYSMFFGFFFLGRVVWMGMEWPNPYQFQNWAKSVIRQRTGRGDG